ncbi:fumarylacetoacetate hydrolase family protein [Trinickia acidisoli]|uniref:fumarylacetoacetate hydrolase family protein n=1 Tax=Trinickia acidisoli TaxID=2767482 RepID=UPI001A8EFCE6|nr:fumarylacetoacetate hydrolase family protein [Trinickia acidisoli]
MRLPCIADVATHVSCGEVDVGTVYGAALNFGSALKALGEAVYAPPYGKPPCAPVLHIKPANTHVPHGAHVTVPNGARELEIGASLAVVIGRRAVRVPKARALDHVLGYTLASDIGMPNPSYYRPAVRFKCRDGFCPLGPAVVLPQSIRNPNELRIVVRIDGDVRQESYTSDALRSVEALIADVTAFMTLDAGDVLLLGTPADTPRARAGARIEIIADEIGTLAHTLVAEGEA